MEIKNLRKEMPFKWKIQGFTKSQKATCVAYIDSRQVQDILDDVCGAENWQDEYYQVKNTMCCKIGIKLGTDWVWKGDGGTESDFEKEKGELSDSFKRAAVKWGIGRFLYDKDIVYLAKDVFEANKFKLTEYINEGKHKRNSYKEPATHKEVEKELKKKEFSI